ncbi:hypothetical protein ABZ741_24995, partial [Streptomyces globisporus]
MTGHLSATDSCERLDPARISRKSNGSGPEGSSRPVPVRPALSLEDHVSRSLSRRSVLATTAAAAT